MKVMGITNVEGKNVPTLIAPSVDIHNLQSKTLSNDTELLGYFGSSNGKFLVSDLMGFLGLSPFGDGSDGDVTIDAGQSVTLTRDMNYNNLTVNGTLNPNGYIIRVMGTFSGSGTIQRNGNNANGKTGGTALNAGSIGPNVAGQDGVGYGAISTGYNATLAYTNKSGGKGKAASGDSIKGTSYQGINYNKMLLKSIYIPEIIPYTTGGGASGGTGNGSSGIGGGAGSNGGVIIIKAKIINFTGTFEAKGGNGGSYSNSGGGGGGMGGVIVLIYHNLIEQGTVILSGGIGGSSSAGASYSGDTGDTGELITIQI